MLGETQKLGATPKVSRVPRYVLAVLLSFGWGITSSATPARAQAEQGGKKDGAPKSQAGQSKEITFKLLIMSDGVTANGVWGHTDQYVASDGNKVFVLFMKFDSLSDLNAASQEISKHATTILERIQRVNKDGAKSGEKVLALFPAKTSTQEVCSLILTNDLTLRQISSDSREDVLAMEKFLRLQ